MKKSILIAGLYCFRRLMATLRLRKVILHAEALLYFRGRLAHGWLISAMG
jgi:hypothetical protein